MAVGITLTHGTHTVRLEMFGGGGVTRQYVDAATLNFSATGSAIQSGNTRVARRLWTVSLLADNDTAYDLEDLYRAWDTLRATGAVAIVTLVDEVNVRNPASPTTASTVFTEPVNIEVVPNGAGYYRVSFGLNEV